MKLLAVFIGLLGASFAQGATLTSVGVLDANYPYSLVRAVKVGPDGTVYAVGESRSNTWSHYIPPGQTEPTQSPNHPFIWDSVNGIQELVNPSGIASEARGVDIRLGKGTGGVDQILIGGRIGAISRSYKADVTNLTGGSWAPLPSTAYDQTHFRPGDYNQIRTDTVVADGRWYMPYTLSSNTNRVGRWRGDPNIEFDLSTTGPVSMGGVAGTGRIIGTDRAGLPRRAIFVTVPGDITPVPGGGGLRNEGLGISTNGQWLCGIDYIDTVTTVYQAFVWQHGSPGMTLLGQYGPCDTRSAAYSVSNAGIAVGFSWNPADGEVAVIWDTTGTWDSTGQARRVTDLLSGNGVDTSGWTKLQRVLSISDDGMVIAGWGIWAADSSVRGFVARLTSPLTPVAPPVLGACCVSEGPNAGTCRVGTPAECAATPFGFYRGDNTCCDACPGACCNANATCSIALQENCTAANGIFRGPSTLCENVSCAGACCQGFKTCEQALYGACDGDFAGIGVSCETADCQCTDGGRVWADTDTDGDVDMDDFGYFQRCFAGTDNLVGAGCECLNKVNDATIDGADFGEFLKCATGAEVPWTPVLTPNCVP